MKHQREPKFYPDAKHGVGVAQVHNSAPRHAAANLVVHAAFAATGIVTVLLGPILPILISRWSLTDERAGLFFTAQFCGQLAGCLSTGLLIPLRRCGYRVTFAIGFALVAIGVVTLGVGNAHAALEGTAIYGYGLGLALTGGNLWVAEIFPARRATAVSILNVTWTIGAIACGPLVMLAERTHVLSKFLAAVAIVIAICALLLGAWQIEPPENLASQDSDAAGRAETRKLFSPPAIALGALFFFYVGTEIAVGGWVAAYANRVEEISAVMSALTPAFFWGGLMTGPCTRATFSSCTSRASVDGLRLDPRGNLDGQPSICFHISRCDFLRGAGGSRTGVRLSDIGGMAGSNLRSVRAAFWQHPICDRQPRRCDASVAGGRGVDAHRRASRWTRRPDCGVCRNVALEWIFPLAPRRLISAEFLQQCPRVSRTFWSFAVFEIGKNISAARENSHPLSDLLARRRRILVFSQANIRKIRGANAWRFNFVALSHTERDICLAKSAEHFVVEPRSVSKLEGRPETRRQASQKILKWRQVQLQIRWQLKKHRSQLS